MKFRICSALFVLFFLVVNVISPIQSYAKELDNNIVVYLFSGKECPHCQDEIEFFKEYLKSNTDVELKDFEVWHNAENRIILEKVGDFFDIQLGSVPFTVIGDKYIVGFGSAETTGAQINNLIESYRKNGINDVVKPILEVVNNPAPIKTEEQENNTTTIPLFGEVNLSKVSLPIISAGIGLVDGFNPCAMWSLIALLGVLLALKSRARLIFIGGLFLIVSGIVYFMFLAAWFEMIQFVGYVYTIRVIIAVASVIGGIYAIYKYITKPKGVCDISETQRQKKISSITNNLIKNPNVIFAVVGVIIAAFAVNIIELMCSVGLPLVFTQTLALQHIEGISRYWYLFIYTFFYMLDDIIIYLIAIWTTKIHMFSGAYSKYSSLVGGLLMIALGIFLLI